MLLDDGGEVEIIRPIIVAKLTASPAKCRDGFFTFEQPSLLRPFGSIAAKIFDGLQENAPPGDPAAFDIGLLFCFTEAPLHPFPVALRDRDSPGWPNLHRTHQCRLPRCWRLAGGIPRRH
jgi:hypothetical protein